MEVKLPPLQLRKDLEERGIYAGQPLAGDPSHTQVMWPRPDGRDYVDLFPYLGPDRELSYDQLSFVELHFQFWEQARDFLDHRFYPEAIAKLKAANPGLIIYGHLPFLEIPPGERQPFRLNYLLLKPPASLIEDCRDQGLEAKEIEPEDFNSLIEAVAASGISYITLHLSSPGFFLDDHEFKIARKKAERVASFAKRVGVAIGIETGGLREDQLRALSQLENVQITWDEEHAMLDGLSHDSLAVLLASDKVGLVHLAVPRERKHNKSPLTRLNSDQRKRIKKVVELVAPKSKSRIENGGRPIPMMFETQPPTLENYRIILQMANLNKELVDKF